MTYERNCGVWRVQCEVSSAKSAVRSVECEVWSVKSAVPGSMLSEVELSRFLRLIRRFLQEVFNTKHLAPTWHCHSCSRSALAWCVVCTFAGKCGRITEALGEISFEGAPLVHSGITVSTGLETPIRCQVNGKGLEANGSASRFYTFAASRHHQHWSAQDGVPLSSVD